MEDGKSCIYKLNIYIHKSGKKTREDRIPRVIIVAALIVHKIFELMYLYINKMRLKTKS